MAFDAGTFGGSFLSAFTQAKQNAQNNKQEQEEKKARLKLYEIQLEREKTAQAAQQQQQDALGQLFSKLQGGASGPVTPPNGIPDAQGPVPGGAPAKPMSLTELLADPSSAMLMLRSGMLKGEDLLKREDAAANRTMFESLIGGAGGKGAPAGMELSAVKLDPSGRPMLDFERPRVWQEVPSPDGMSRILLDRQGREIGRRPVAPNERPQPTSEDARQRDIAAVLKTYEEAKAGLLKGLEGTVTGPLIGKLPAITSAQQTAKGSVAAMAPVLKQLFRAAGEGVFTDRDQQLLIDMIPDRETNPEARASMIANIDAIVRAKLGMGARGDQAPTNVIDFSQLPP